MYTKLSKSEFWLLQVTFLGNIITNERILVNPSKIEVVRNQPRPSNVPEVHSFMCLEEYYRWFVDGFSRIATLLTELTKKKIKYVDRLVLAYVSKSFSS